MSKEKIFEVEYNNTNFIRRYPPEGIFAEGTGFSKQPTIVQHPDIYQKHESITDKESYRLSLTSARGALSNLNPEQQKGMYLFPDGKYDKSKDISYILRKDLSLVEIDDYLFKLRQNIENADEELTDYIKDISFKLEEKRDQLIFKEQNSDNSSVGSE